jgi:hypothetical protein
MHLRPKIDTLVEHALKAGGAYGDVLPPSRRWLADNVKYSINDRSTTHDKPLAQFRLQKLTLYWAQI